MWFDTFTNKERQPENLRDTNKRYLKNTIGLLPTAFVYKIASRAQVFEILKVFYYQLWTVGSTLFIVVQHIDSFLADVLILYHLETPEKLSGVFREYKSGTLARNNPNN